MAGTAAATGAATSATTRRNRSRHPQARVANTNRESSMTSQRRLLREGSFLRWLRTD